MHLHLVGGAVSDRNGQPACMPLIAELALYNVFMSHIRRGSLSFVRLKIFLPMVF